MFILYHKARHLAQQIAVVSTVVLMIMLTPAFAMEEQMGQIRLGPFIVPAEHGSDFVHTVFLKENMMKVPMGGSGVSVISGRSICG